MRPYHHTILMLSLALPLLAACGKQTSPSLPASAAPTPVKETEMGMVRLSSESVQRLDITTTPAVISKVARHRLYGGEIMVPPGQSAWVNAPIAGLIATTDGALLPGAVVQKGQVILTLHPQLSAESRATLSLSLIEADAQVSNTQRQLEIAQANYERAQRLFLDKVGSKKNMEDAEATYRLAQHSQDAALSRQRSLRRVSGEHNPDTVQVRAAQSGILRNIAVMAGQSVNAGSPLFELSHQQTLWLKLSVPAGDLADIARFDAVSIEGLTLQGGGIKATAQPMGTPYLANPSSASIDLMYQIKAPHEALIPGQRVNVSVPLHHFEGAMALPWSAVVTDINGGNWVYQELAAAQYIRRRVDIRFVTDQYAVFDKGLPVGTKVVTHGAQELFGVETGFSH